MFKTILSVVVGWAVAGTAMAGAFGIDMGETASKLKILATLDKTETSTLYHVEPPVRNAEFENYLATVNDHTGVCSLHAFSPTYEGDLDGRQVKPGFDKIKKILTEKYGDTETATIYTESFGKNGKNFASALFYENDGVFAVWDFDGDEGGDLHSIALIIVADSPTATSMSLVYEFKNVEGCDGISEE